MSSDYIQLVQSYGAAIDDGLNTCFKEAQSLFSASLSAHSLAALEKLREYSLRPSKRLRGSLGAFAYDYAAHTSYGRAGISAGVALELVQSYLLIVDDVMDKSELRRGGPTMHRLYQQEGQENHNANMMAVDVGLIAQHLVNIILTNIQEDSHSIIKAIQILHRNVGITGFGQLDDLQQHAHQNIDEQSVINKYVFKSSYYTFINPIQVGLVLGGMHDSRVLDEVERFGTAAGIAFQLHDDVLGIFGDVAMTGKSNLDDLKEGKYTLLLHHALQNANTEEVSLLGDVIGNTDITEKELHLVQTVLENGGSKKFVEAKATWYALQAKSVLNESEFWDTTAKSILESLVDYSISRKK